MCFWGYPVTAPSVVFFFFKLLLFACFLWHRNKLWLSDLSHTIDIHSYELRHFQRLENEEMGSNDLLFLKQYQYFPWPVLLENQWHPLPPISSNIKLPAGVWVCDQCLLLSLTYYRFIRKDWYDQNLYSFIFGKQNKKGIQKIYFFKSFSNVWRQQWVTANVGTCGHLCIFKDKICICAHFPSIPHFWFNVWGFGVSQTIRSMFYLN